jgi:long-chain acyl-CoA synthetase
MFSRMLKLPADVRASAYDLSSLRSRSMPRRPASAAGQGRTSSNGGGRSIHEYYGATEGLGFTCLQQPRSGWPIAAPSERCLLGDLHILDENMQACPVGTPGTVWFKTATPVRIFQRSGQDQEPVRRRHA